MRRNSAMAEPVTDEVSNHGGPRGRYVYAVIDDDKDQKPLDVVGLDGSRVYTLSDGRHSAVVSDIPNGRIRPERSGWRPITEYSKGCWPPRAFSPWRSE